MLLTVLSGGSADPTKILFGGTEIVGGVDVGAQVSSGGTQVVNGRASSATVFAGGTENRWAPVVRRSARWCRAGRRSKCSAAAPP